MMRRNGCNQFDGRGRALAAFVVCCVLTWGRCAGAADESAGEKPLVDRSPLRGALWAQSSDEDHARAGCPQAVRPHARTSRGPAQVGYYVGGGAAVRGEARDASRDGTWGVDYQPRWLPRAVVLGWTHGRKEQGGQGAYRTDGPQLRRE